MSSIDALLNHEPAGERRASATAFPAPATTFDAADALTTLATLGSGQQYASAPPRDLPSPTANANANADAPRRTSSVASLHAPVEPSPPLGSPTLEHYHHGSHSPEEQRRRESFLARSSPAPVLAPIQNLSSALQEHTRDGDAATPIGTDVSQIVPPSSRSSEGGEPVRDCTQDREPAFVRNDPTTTQIREPESSQDARPLSHDEDGLIKNEPSATPREHTPPANAPQLDRQASIGDSMDAETLKAIEIAKQSDLGLRNKRTGSVAENVASPVDPKPTTAPSKKRSAPSSAAKKKGTAKAMKPSKKRKIDADDASTARSATPASRPSKPKPTKKGSQAGTPALESSPAPDGSSQVYPSDEDGDSSEDHNLYCLCKQPDNHRWMIGCDGGCEDWFHGDCVDMKQADEDLVDRFICPNCEKHGKGHTTWKPMCRRDGCRQPARLGKDRESKYCTDDCGVLFMQEQLQRTAGAKGVNGSKGSKKAKKKTPGTDVIEEEEPTPLGGVLRAKDLKALVDASPNIQAFKNLGSGVLSPPQTASPTRGTFTNGNGENLALTAGETERLSALYKEKSQLQDRLEVLKDREKFVSMAKEQAIRVADREKIKIKEFCGYDSRLSWSDAEFLLWRNSKHGQASFKFSTLAPTAEQIASMTTVNGATNIEADLSEAVCLKKRCPKHPQWQKLNLQDARFEELEVVEAIRECEKEEKSVRERARRRGAKDGLAKELTAGDGSHEERNRDGWVEMVA
ncbi:COMPASS (complex proteins associated with Set1p) component [Coniothyrium glycines]